MAVVARCYASGDQARRAYDALLENGYSKSIVALVVPPSGAPAAGAPAAGLDATGDDAGSGAYAAPGAAPPGGAVDADIYSTAIRAGSLLGDQAEYYLAQLEDGAALVVVDPPFGSALKATQILDQHQPLKRIEDAAPRPQPYRFISQDPTPLSSAFGLGVLADSSWSLSEAFGLKLQSRGLSFMSRWFGELGRHDYTLSDKFGLRFLSRNPAPLSSMLGMSTKSGKSGETWTRSMGFRMLSDNAAPVSGFLGIPLLKGQNDSQSYAPRRHRREFSNRAAPLSGLFGLKPLSSGRHTIMARMFPPLTRPDFTLLGQPSLSRNPAPLSSLVGMKVLSARTDDEWTSSMGLPLLSRNNPSPLSDLLGWSVLARGRLMY